MNSDRYVTRKLHSISRGSLRVKSGFIEIWSNKSDEETPVEMIFVIPTFYLGMFAANLIHFQKVLKEASKNIDVSKPPEITPEDLEFGNKAYLNGKHCTMSIRSDRVTCLKYGDIITEIAQASNLIILMREILIVAPVALTSNKHYQKILNKLLYYSNTPHNTLPTYMDKIDALCDPETYCFFTANWDYVIAMNMLKEGSINAPMCEKGQVYVKFVKYSKKRKFQNEGNTSQNGQIENETQK